MKKNIWRPLSSNAYGANAFFIPEWGGQTAIEFILIMTQNYPEYKAHPALDLFHNYVDGPERFDSNYEFRVLGWETDNDFKKWSFLYLPTKRNDIKATAVFVPSKNGNMRLFLDMENPSAEEREWEFHLYIAPCRGISLPGYKSVSMSAEGYSFTIDNVKMRLAPSNMTVSDISEVKSDFWIPFPFNANELSSDPCNPRSRSKKRILVKFSPVVIKRRGKNTAVLDFIQGVGKKRFTVNRGNFPSKSHEEPAYKHLWWETLHNQQYTKSFADGSMTNRVIPGREWGRFFMWDAGMSAVGAVEEDERIAGEIIKEMPDPAKMGKQTFGYGSFVPTAVFALWELYQKKGRREILERHYDAMKNLVFAMYFYPFNEGDAGHDGMVRPVNNHTGVDDYPALVYADGWPYAWDYKRTLTVNPARKKIQIISVGMTSMAVRMLKILRLAAYILGKKDDIAVYAGMIYKSEKAMNENYWDSRQECFLNRLESEKKLLDIKGVYEYFPLFSGSVDAGRSGIMMKKLTDAKKYRTPYGITVVALDDKDYREDGYWNGGIWIPTQWFFWKTFYNTGRMELAVKIADSAIKLWESNHEKTLCSWEEFRVNGGTPAGNSRFSGLSTPLMALWKGRRGPGRIQAGQEMILKVRRDSGNECFEIYAETPFYGGPAGLSVVAAKAETEYSVNIEGEEIKKIVSDAYGYMGFSVNMNAGEKKKIAISPSNP